MRACEVCVVGGGPAGSSCARRLVRAGIDVHLIDKANFPRDKTCAGWITPEVVAALDIDLNEYRSGRTLQPIHAFMIGVIEGSAIRIAFDSPVSYGIRRCEFDSWLLGQCRAEMTLGHAVHKIERADDGWMIDDLIRARMLVGAGGHFCPVANKFASHEKDGEGVVFAQEIEYLLDDGDRPSCAVSADTPEIYFCPDFSGYGWCFRKGDYLNVGLGRQDRDGLSDHVRRFSAWLVKAGRIGAIPARRMHGHAYALHGSTSRPLASDGALLIGDSAGLAHPYSGEGIRPAVESGLIAAETIIAAGGDYRAAKLSDYPRRIQERFGRRAPVFSLSSLMPRALRRNLAAWLMRTNWFAKEVVVENWFLRRRLAPLLPCPA